MQIVFKNGQKTLKLVRRKALSVIKSFPWYKTGHRPNKNLKMHINLLFIYLFFYLSQMMSIVLGSSYKVDVYSFVNFSGCFLLVNEAIKTEWKAMIDSWALPLGRLVSGLLRRQALKGIIKMTAHTSEIFCLHFCTKGGSRDTSFIFIYISDGNICWAVSKGLGFVKGSYASTQRRKCYPRANVFFWGKIILIIMYYFISALKNKGSIDPTLWYICTFEMFDLCCTGTSPYTSVFWYPSSCFWKFHSDLKILQTQTWWCCS